MAVPILAIIAIAAQAVGAIGSAISSLSEGDATSKYHEHLADTSEKEADLILASAARKRQFISEGASRQKEAIRDKFKSIISSQKVATASSGFFGGDVTSIDVALNSLELSQRDEELLEYNANVTAFDVQNQATITATGLRDQAAGHRESATSAIEAAKTRVWSTVLTGSSGIASTAAQFYGGGKK